MTIIELSLLKSWSQFKYLQPFVYQATPGQFEGAEFWLELFGVADDTVTDPINILEFLESPAYVYDTASSLANCIATEASWYWDYDAQLLTVHFDHDSSPLSDSFSYGEASGYSDETVVYIGGIEYLPLIDSISEISAQQDIVNYDILADSVGNVRLKNLVNSRTGNGYLDFLITENVYGNALNVYTIPGNGTDYERTDLTQRISASVDDYDINLNEVVLRYRDNRQFQRQTIPTEVFTVADYPDIEDDVANTVIPIIYGEVREVPAICTNGTLTSGAVNFRVALELDSIGTVYVRENDEWTEVTPIWTELAIGEFGLDAADARSAAGQILQCKVVGCVGIPVTYSTDIIVDINDRFLGKDFTDSHFDTTEWAAEETSFETAGLYIAEEAEITEIIRRLQNGSNVGFRYEINATGKQTIRVDDESRAVVLHVPNVALLNRDSIPVTTDKDLLAAVVRIQYEKSYVSGKYISLTDDSEADTVQKEYRVRPYQEYETLLTSAAHAQDRADYVLDRFSTIRGIVSLDIMGSVYMDLRIYDIITAELTPSKFVNLDDSSVSGRLFFGLKKIKVLSTRLDLRAKVNRITGVIIGDMS